MTSYHRAHWAHDAGEFPRVTFTCSAPDTEVCRQMCSEERCETIPCEHVVTAPKGRCLFVDWFDAAGDPEEAFSGDEAPRDGAVEPEWQGDYYTWDYVPLTWSQRETLKAIAQW